MAHMRVMHRDEEGRKNVLEKVPIPKTRHRDTARHFERKLQEQGLHRLERHPANGRCGKYTWEGPDGLAESELEPVPPAINPNDPNYVQEDDEVAKEVVISEVEVAKVAEARDGVARMDVAPPIQP